MYKFDIEQFLNAFDNDEEKMIHAFTDQLNETLAARRESQKKQDEAINAVVDAWNKFVMVYCSAHPDQFKGVDPKDFFWTKSTPMDTLNVVYAAADTIHSIFGEPQDTKEFEDQIQGFLNKMGW